VDEALLNFYVEYVRALCAQGIEANVRSLDATQDAYVDPPKKITAVEIKR